MMKTIVEESLVTFKELGQKIFVISSTSDHRISHGKAWKLVQKFGG